MKRQDKNIDEFRQSVTTKALSHIKHNPLHKDERCNGLTEYLVANMSKIVEESVGVRIYREHYQDDNKVGHYRYRYILELTPTWVEYEGETYTVSFKHHPTYYAIAELCQNKDPWFGLEAEASLTVARALSGVCNDYILDLNHNNK